MEAEYNPGLQVSETIHSNIEVTMRVLEQLTELIAQASELITQSLLSDNKILCCGVGQGAALSQIFSTQLLNRFQYERPGLPAVNLSVDATTITAITQDNSFQDIFSNPIRALGQPGDILFMVCDAGSNAGLQAIQSAHDREMLTVALTGQDCKHISSLMLPEDIELCIPSSSRARVCEAQLLLINSICDQLEKQLFGGY